jgi:hypothetical protein
MKYEQAHVKKTNDNEMKPDFFPSELITIGIYKAHKGKKKELMELMLQHQPLLRKEGLLTEKEGFIGLTQDNSIIEIYEWKSIGSVQQAKKNPRVQELWKKVHKISDSLGMNKITESKKSTPGFRSLKKSELRK